MKILENFIKLVKRITSSIFYFPENKKRTISLPPLPINSSLNSDWEKIGLDMWNAIHKLESQKFLKNRYKDNNDRNEII